MSTRQVTQRNVGRLTAGVDKVVALDGPARMAMARETLRTMLSWEPLPVREHPGRRRRTEPASSCPVQLLDVIDLSPAAKQEMQAWLPMFGFLLDDLTCVGEDQLLARNPVRGAIWLWRNLASGGIINEAWLDRPDRPLREDNTWQYPG